MQIQAQKIYLFREFVLRAQLVLDDADVACLPEKETLERLENELIPLLNALGKRPE